MFDPLGHSSVRMGKRVDFMQIFNTFVFVTFYDIMTQSERSLKFMRIDLIKRNVLALAITILFAFAFVGCSGSNLTVVPITAPWDKMALPIGQKDIVHKSSETELGVVAYDPPAGLFERYIKAIEASGWERTSVGPSGDMVNFKKDGKKMNFMYFNNSDEGYYSISFVID